MTIRCSLKFSCNTRIKGVLLTLAGMLFLSVQPTLAASTQLTWYGQAAFKIVTPSGGVVLIDPWLTNPKNPDKDALDKLERVDYILITHAHGDHVGDAVVIAEETGAKLVTSAGLRRNLVSVHEYPPEHATLATSGNVGGTIKLPKAGMTVTIVNAIHGSELKLNEQTENGIAIVTGGNPIGFVVVVEGGPTFYHTGDTDVFTDMKLIDEFFEVDVMLATIGDHFTMGPERAALAVQFVKPKVVVPMHYGTFSLLTGRPGPFGAAIVKRGLSTRMDAMKPGDTRTY